MPKKLIVAVILFLSISLCSAQAKKKIPTKSEKFYRAVFRTKRKDFSLGQVVLAKRIVELLKQAKSDMIKQDHKALEIFSIHPYIITQSGDRDRRQMRIRQAAFVNTDAWILWLELKKYHLDAFKKNLEAYKVLDNADKQKHWKSVISYISKLKYMTEDTKEWDEILHLSLSIVKKNPYPLTNQKVFLYYINTLCTNIGNFTVWDNSFKTSRVIFKKNDGKFRQVQIEFIEWCLKDDNKFIQLVGAERALKASWPARWYPMENRRANSSVTKYSEIALQLFLDILEKHPMLIERNSLSFPTKPFSLAIKFSYPTEKYCKLGMAIFDKYFNHRLKHFLSINRPFMTWLETVSYKDAVIDQEQMVPWVNKRIPFMKKRLYQETKTPAYTELEVNKLEGYRQQFFTNHDLEMPAPEHGKIWDKFEVKEIPMPGMHLSDKKSQTYYKPFRHHIGIYQSKICT
ncbi:MAG: hypothetical protein HRT89_08495, partial [Lentisphaeria bacterium]|nr:hypothetical protein [Lentisphaeria bacterium]NQZ68095.1 hypothetical protein [Lentisphaeria bacterium]